LAHGRRIPAGVEGFGRFWEPLNNLVGAVRALEAGDYNYPVAAQSNDELEEVTLAFEDMRATLQASQKKLIQSERLAAIGQMASSISHDLRHSLSAIIANAEFLSDEKLEDETRWLCTRKFDPPWSK